MGGPTTPPSLGTGDELNKSTAEGILVQFPEGFLTQKSNYQKSRTRFCCGLFRSENRQKLQVYEHNLGDTEGSIIIRRAR